MSKFDYAMSVFTWVMILWINIRIGNLKYRTDWIACWQGGIIDRLERIERKGEQFDESGDQ